MLSRDFLRIAGIIQRRLVANRYRESHSMRRAGGSGDCIGCAFHVPESRLINMQATGRGLEPQLLGMIRVV